MEDGIIKIKNDGKERYQSFTASVSQDGSTSMGHYTTYFEAYGRNEYEAKANVVEQVDTLIKNLKRIKDQIPV